jgi:hypothetical protein
MSCLRILLDTPMRAMVQNPVKLVTVARASAWA